MKLTAKIQLVLVYVRDSKTKYFYEITDATPEFISAYKSARQAMNLKYDTAKDSGLPAYHSDINYEDGTVICVNTEENKFFVDNSEALLIREECKNNPELAKLIAGEQLAKIKARSKRMQERAFGLVKVVQAIPSDDLLSQL